MRFQKRADRPIANRAQHGEEVFTSPNGEERYGVCDDVGVFVVVGGEEEADCEAAGGGAGVVVGNAGEAGAIGEAGEEGRGGGGEVGGGGEGGGDAVGGEGAPEETAFGVCWGGWLGR